MRYLVGLICVLVLGVVPLVGCGETTGDGGTGGSAPSGGVGGSGGSVGGGGMGGDGGTGGMPECLTAEDCDDGNECTADWCGDGLMGPTPAGECGNMALPDNTDCDLKGLPGLCLAGVCTDAMLCEGVVCEAECRINGTCDPNDGMCDYTFLEDGTACSLGECLNGVCATVGAFPCNEQGIRDAIATGGGPHFFACEGTLPVVTAAEIAIDNDVILDGQGNLTVDGNNEHRVFLIRSADVVVELHGLTVSGGEASGAFPEDQGGGIYNEGSLTFANGGISGNRASRSGGGVFNSGTLTLTDSTVSGNRSSTGGGIHNSRTMTVTNSTVSDNANSGIANDADLTLINSKVLRNGSPGGGGGIDNGLVGTLTLTDSSVSENSSGYFGGGIFGGGQVTLANSVVTGNAAPYGGGIACWPAMTLTLIDSTVSGNTAHRVGGAGGVAAWGGASGGISCGGLGQVTLTNSTVSGNTAEGPAGGIFGGWQVTLTNSTVSGNTAESGSAIFQNGGTLTLLNSTVSGSVHAQPAVSDFGPPSPASVVTTATLIAGACTQEGDLVTWTSNGYNIESPGETCGFDEAKGDQFNVTEGQLNLGELANNGGPTMTHALLTVPVVSAAIDQIPAADCVDADGEPLIEDQRGERRPETGGTMCDVGSFEVQP